MQSAVSVYISSHFVIVWILKLLQMLHQHFSEIKHNWALNPNILYMPPNTITDYTKLIFSLNLILAKCTATAFCLCWAWLCIKFQSPLESPHSKSAMLFLGHCKMYLMIMGSGNRLFWACPLTDQCEWTSTSVVKKQWPCIIMTEGWRWGLTIDLHVAFRTVNMFLYHLFDF